MILAGADLHRLGAHGDGRSDDTVPLQAALDACAGGGRLELPPGTWSCNTLHLRSGLTLHLAAGAVLHSREDDAAYPVIAPTPNLPGRIQAFLWGEGCEDLVIEGPGSIDGGHPEALSGAQAAQQPFRPALVFLRGCRRLRLAGCTLRDSAFWTLHLQRCEDVLLDGLTLRSHLGRINADGIDPDGCRRVVVRGCDVETGDDALVLKSTEGDACEDVVVEDCTLRSGCAAFKLGTETVGPICRVLVRHCRISSRDRAIALHLKDGGGIADIAVEDCRLQADGQFAVLIDASPRHPGQGSPGRIRGVRLERLQVSSPGRLLAEGHPGAEIEGLRIVDLAWEATGPLDPAARKPAGAARVSGPPPGPAPAARCATRLVRGLVVEGFCVTGEASAVPQLHA